MFNTSSASPNFGLGGNATATSVSANNSTITNANNPSSTVLSANLPAELLELVGNFRTFIQSQQTCSENMNRENLSQKLASTGEKSNSFSTELNQCLAKSITLQEKVRKVKEQTRNDLKNVRCFQTTNFDSDQLIRQLWGIVNEYERQVADYSAKLDFFQRFVNSASSSTQISDILLKLKKLDEIHGILAQEVNEVHYHIQALCEKFNLRVNKTEKLSQNQSINASFRDSTRFLQQQGPTPFSQSSALAIFEIAKALTTNSAASVGNPLYNQTLLNQPQQRPVENTGLQNLFGGGGK